MFAKLSVHEISGTRRVQKLFADLDAVGATGAPITIWTYNSAFNPDPSRKGAEPRQTLYDLYQQHRAN